MKQISLSTYAELDQVLKAAASNIDAAEAHGLLCGLLCGKDNSTAAWQEWVNPAHHAKIEQDLQEISARSAQQLKEFSFEFELILPDDDTLLPKRAEALVLWCQGFLTGLDAAKVPVTGRAPGEATEVIDDLVEIAKMNYEVVVANEEDEEAYTELVEYVRMGVVMVYQTLKEEGGVKKATHQPSRQKH